MALIEDAGTRIRNAQEEGTRLIQEAQLPEEPSGVAFAVERHRWAWRPDAVRLLVIAESHVFTSADDLALRLHSSDLPPEAWHTPTDFVRLVYCLGYGENGLLEGTDRRTGFSNRGSPQYWSIFGRLAGRRDQPLRGQGATLERRLRWKVDILVALKQRGIWLLDASLHGIYAPSIANDVPADAPAGRNRVPIGLAEALHDVWWRHYGRWLIEQCPGAGVWAIGGGVQSLLSRCGVPLGGWIYQPQAMITNERREERWKFLDAAVDELAR